MSQPNENETVASIQFSGSLRLIMNTRNELHFRRLKDGKERALKLFNCNQSNISELINALETMLLISGNSKKYEPKNKPVAEHRGRKKHEPDDGSLEQALHRLRA